MTLLSILLQVATDLRNEKINYKVREHSLQKVPVILVCGKREAEENTVNMRRLGSRDQESMTLDEAIARLDTLPSAGLRIEGKGGDAPDRLAARLRELPMPVIGHIRDAALILDLRCLDDDDALLDALAALGAA